MKNIQTYESFLNESVGDLFIKLHFNSHGDHNDQCDILEGHLNTDSMICYGIYIKDGATAKKGDEFMEYYSGENYAVGSKKRSKSNHYTVDKIPAKYKAAWLNLKAQYEAMPEKMRDKSFSVESSNIIEKK